MIMNPSQVIQRRKSLTTFENTSQLLLKNVSTAETFSGIMMSFHPHFSHFAFCVPVLGGLTFGELRCVGMEEFLYVDPKDKTMVMNQGIILNFASGERAIYRLSGTGSEGATIRIYLETFQGRVPLQGQATSTALKKVSDAALAAASIEAITGRQSPSLIT